MAQSLQRGRGEHKRGERPRPVHAYIAFSDPLDHKRAGRLGILKDSLAAGGLISTVLILVSSLFDHKFSALHMYVCK